MRPLPLAIYRITGFFLYPLACLAAPLMRFLPGRIASHFSQRLGRYEGDEAVAPAGGEAVTIWVHAASVGEVRAALLVLAALRREYGAYRCLLTTTTQQGYALARSSLPQDTPCLMAPLDMPQAVSRALTFIRPCLYICLETELWPLALGTLQARRVPMVLLNGRMSERSLRCYRTIRASIAAVLQGFGQMALISQQDLERFARLGMPRERMQVAGNIKFDLPFDGDRARAIRAEHRNRLGLATQERVLICGSTHGGEEALLLSLFTELSSAMPLVLVLAPRHLERLAEVAALLRARGIDHELYSQMQGQHRARVVLVDTMGDLADLYSAGDFLFCGGSLLPRLSGHNVMEAARWSRPVYFGPYMRDWQAAADLLLQAGGGFQAQDMAALAALIRGHAASVDSYRQACQAAGDIAAAQRGALARQLSLLDDFLIRTGSQAAGAAA